MLTFIYFSSGLCKNIAVHLESGVENIKLSHFFCPIQPASILALASISLARNLMGYVLIFVIFTVGFFLMTAYLFPLGSVKFLAPLRVLASEAAFFRNNSSLIGTVWLRSFYGPVVSYEFM